MSAFTVAELEYLKSQPLMRFASASVNGRPDVAPVVFEIDGDDVLTAGFDIAHGSLPKHSIKPQSLGCR
jgi:hypothetical protein